MHSRRKNPTQIDRSRETLIPEIKINIYYLVILLTHIYPLDKQKEKTILRNICVKLGFRGKVNADTQVTTTLHLLLLIMSENAIICLKGRLKVRRYSHYRENTHTVAQKCDSITILHVNQHSITFLVIHMRHSAYEREKYTFINANIEVINTILKVNRDNRQTLKCKHYSLAFS